jgi:hypothetical protein
MRSAGDGTCRAQIGLLVLRPCGDPVEAACASCGLPICARHSVDTSGGARCPECATRYGDEARGDATTRARKRKRYHDEYDHHPSYWYYGDYYGSDYYGADDQAAVEGSGAAPLPEATSGEAAAFDDELDELDDWES